MPLLNRMAVSQKPKVALQNCFTLLFVDMTCRFVYLDSSCIYFRGVYLCLCCQHGSIVALCALHCQKLQNCCDGQSMKQPQGSATSPRRAVYFKVQWGNFQKPALQGLREQSCMCQVTGFVSVLLPVVLRSSLFKNTETVTGHVCKHAEL